MDTSNGFSLFLTAFKLFFFVVGLVDEERRAKLPIDVPSITKLLPYEERDVTRLKHLITKLQELVHRQNYLYNTKTIVF